MVGGVHGMDTMGQLLKENYDPLKRTFGGFGVKLFVPTSYSFQCSSFYLCHWQRYVTFNMWVTRVTTVVVTIVQGYFWSQLCRNIVGHNCARISFETIVPIGPRPQPCGGSKGEKGVSNRWSAYLMEVDVLRMLRYCRMSGTVIRRSARRNRSPELKRYFFSYLTKNIPQHQVLLR